MTQDPDPFAEHAEHETRQVAALAAAAERGIRVPQPEDTFVSPTGPNARFPEREMRVLRVFWVEDDGGGAVWVDAEPVRPQENDMFGFHVQTRR